MQKIEKYLVHKSYSIDMQIIDKNFDLSKSRYVHENKQDNNL